MSRATPKLENLKGEGIGSSAGYPRNKFWATENINEWG